MSIRRFLSSPATLRAAVAATTFVAIVVPITAQTQTATELYQQDRANCLNGNTAQSRADCLNEARSVLRDRRAGGLEPGAQSAVAAPADSTAPADNAGGTDALPPRADRG